MGGVLRMLEEKKELVDEGEWRRLQMGALLADKGRKTMIRIGRRRLFQGKRCRTSSSTTSE
jgi:hypothetical protein